MNNENSKSLGNRVSGVFGIPHKHALNLTILDQEIQLCFLFFFPLPSHALCILTKEIIILIINNNVEPKAKISPLYTTHHVTPCPYAYSSSLTPLTLSSSSLSSEP